MASYLKYYISTDTKLFLNSIICSKDTKPKKPKDFVRWLNMQPSVESKYKFVIGQRVLILGDKCFGVVVKCDCTTSLFDDENGDPVNAYLIRSKNGKNWYPEHDLNDCGVVSIGRNNWF